MPNAIESRGMHVALSRLPGTCCPLPSQNLGLLAVSHKKYILMSSPKFINKIYPRLRSKSHASSKRYVEVPLIQVRRFVGLDTDTVSDSMTRHWESRSALVFRTHVDDNSRTRKASSRKKLLKRGTVSKKHSPLT